MIPSEYNFVEDYPLNQSGKIDTQKLKKNNKCVLKKLRPVSMKL